MRISEQELQANPQKYLSLAHTQQVLVVDGDGRVTMVLGIGDLRIDVEPPAEYAEFLSELEQASRGGTASTSAPRHNPWLD